LNGGDAGPLAGASAWRAARAPGHGDRSWSQASRRPVVGPQGRDAVPSSALSASRSCWSQTSFRKTSKCH